MKARNLMTRASRGVEVGVTKALLGRRHNVVANSLKILESQFQPSELPQFPTFLALSFHTVMLHFIRTSGRARRGWRTAHRRWRSDGFRRRLQTLIRRLLAANSLLARMFRLVTNWKRKWVHACISLSR